ncbi:MAG: DNA-3-methyladenine glycosylase [Pirellulales bacterium]
MTPEYWDKAKRALARRDPVLAKVIRAYRGEGLRLRGKGFQTLARAIVGQQISVKAADSIWRRLNKTVVRVTPNRVANAPYEVLRPCGLSNAKVLYLHSLANHFLENTRQIRQWPRMDDEAIIAELTTIKGIGRWTAEMFLIFGLGRPDVFPLDDLGLLKGIYRLYNGGEKLGKAEVMAVGEAWRPYRSLGTWYMWRVLDPVPVLY